MKGTQETKIANDPTVTADRYQAQYKGNGWHVFDSHTNGWGGVTHATARAAQAVCDKLNDRPFAPVYIGG